MASNQHTVYICQLAAIRQMEDDLIRVLEHEIDVVLAKAFGQGIIGEQVRGSDHQSSRVKAEKFVAAVRARITTDPLIYDSFIAILRSSPFLEHLADRLEEKICDSHQPIAETGSFSDVPSGTSTPQTARRPQKGQSLARHHPASNKKVRSRRQKIKRSSRDGYVRKQIRRHSSGFKSQNTCFSAGIPKLDTRDYTDEESGFLDEEDTIASEIINGDNLRDDEEDDLIEFSSTPMNGIAFSTPISEAHCGPNFIKSFANNASEEQNIVKQDSSSENLDSEAEGVQEIEHNTVTQQQVVGGIQTTTEGWAEMAHYCITKGAEKQGSLMKEIEELQVNISKLQELMDRRSAKKQQKMDEQRMELTDCKQKLDNKEKELTLLNEKRTADIKEAEEKLMKEKKAHQIKISAAEKEMKILQEQLDIKSQEAEKLRHESQELQREYDDLKETSEKVIESIKQELEAKTQEAIRLKEDYRKLEEQRKQEIGELKKEYEQKINELETVVKMEKQLAAQKEETLSFKLKAEYLEKEQVRLKEENNLRLKMKDLETQLSKKKEQIARLQKDEQERKHEEAKAQLKMERKRSKTKLQEVERERDHYKMTVQRMSSTSSTSSCDSVSRSNTHDNENDELDAIAEETEVKLQIGRGSESDSDDSFYSCKNE